MDATLFNNPIGNTPVNFGAYVAKMKQQDNLHRINGIPDYAFPLDLKLREKIRKLPVYMQLSKRIAVQNEARYRQLLQASALQVGPNQFPNIYEIALDCAKRLHIGPPNVFVEHDHDLNAYTFASDTATPVIVVTSGAVERLTAGELKCVIGHECGHVHNEHVVYESIVNWIFNAMNAGGLGGMALELLSATTILLFKEWKRAAEVTCDRAGMICSDNVEDAINVNKKLTYGGFLNQDDDPAMVDIEELKRQFGSISTVASVIAEMNNTHPSGIRRVLCSDEFTHCDLLYQWRPELKKPGLELHTKDECDKICEKYTAVIKEERKGAKK